MNNRDELNELRDQLRRRANDTRPTSDLVGGSLIRARRIRRRRTIVAAVTAVVVAGGGVAGAGALRGQWGSGGDVPVAGVTATPSTSASSPSAEPSEAPSATKVPTSPGSPGTSGDPRSSTEPTDPTADPSTSDPSKSSPGKSDTTTPAPPPPPKTSTSEPSSSRSLGTQQAPLCTADETKIEVRAGQGAAGHVEYVITLTNTGDRTCTAHGYPGVSMVAGDDGSQVGAPADRDRDHGPGEPVTVRPGGTATASVLVAQADNYGADCDAVDARGFRIYLPEERSAQFAPADVRGCRSDNIHLMRVRPFVAG